MIGMETEASDRREREERDGFGGHHHGHGHSKVPKGTLRLIVKAYIDELLSQPSLDESEFRNKLLGLRSVLINFVPLLSYIFLFLQ